MLLTVHKVTCFITRNDDRELLVFRHPLAGLQLPAGTVDPGEAVVDAALREAREETGLTHLTPVRELAVISALAMPTDRMLLDDSPLYAEPSTSASAIPIDFGGDKRIDRLRRGLWVRTIEEIGDWIYAAYDTFEWRDEALVLAGSTSGWLPSTSCTADVGRSLWLLRCQESTPDRWTHSDDPGLPAAVDEGVEVFWMPFDPGVPLAGVQSIWLATAYDALSSRAYSNPL
jgi:8-oxo-dGTP pyrophosphatase MutT (NUDIX family)